MPDPLLSAPNVHAGRFVDSQGASRTERLSRSPCPPLSTVATSNPPSETGIVSAGPPAARHTVPPDATSILPENDPLSLPSDSASVAPSATSTEAPPSLTSAEILRTPDVTSSAMASATSPPAAVTSASSVTAGSEASPLIVNVPTPLTVRSIVTAFAAPPSAGTRSIVPPPDETSTPSSYCGSRLNKRTEPFSRLLILSVPPSRWSTDSVGTALFATSNGNPFAASVAPLPIVQSTPDWVIACPKKLKRNFVSTRSEVPGA